MTTPVCSSNSPPQYYERSARLSCVVARSSLLHLFLLLATGQAVLLLWLCDLPLWLFWLSLLLVCVYAFLEKRRLGRMVGVISTRERRWFWRGESDEEREFEFCGELVLLQWLLVIRGRDQAGAPLRLVLARDALNGDDWRRLQVALRYSR
ncbi:protein YgfX [Microbulbifer sp. THAF38]|uniref:protein YgfX n=1 Tax=Microbulbifer sp. THAF38 TaxID=2587856 RepID=UPI001268B0B0|nr:protein YgfX [Microbulbifer sp. THAF38]